MALGGVLLAASLLVGGQALAADNDKPVGKVTIQAAQRGIDGHDEPGSHGIFNARNGVTEALGERARVRAYNEYVFPSDSACRGLGASTVDPSAQISIES